MKRRPWKPVELEVLRRFYADWRTDWIAQALGREIRPVYQKAIGMGLRKSAAYLASPDAHRLDGVKGMGSRFPKGHVPHNKGVLGHPSWSPSTAFPPGHRPHNWKPVGTCKPDHDGYLRVKLREPNVWGFLHELVWASVHGWPRPKGTMIVFRDRNKPNCDPANLELITRAALMARNTIHNYPPEIKSLIRVRSTLVRKINDHEQNRRPAPRAVRSDGQAGRGRESRGRDRAIESDG